MNINFVKETNNLRKSFKQVHDVSEPINVS